MRDTRRSVETSVTTSGAERPRAATTGTSTGVEAGDSSTDPVVPYPNGRYELRGDGMTVPYYWAWVPAQLYIAPPPPPVAG